MTSLRTNILQHFDHAARHYDAAASLQKMVAQELVAGVAQYYQATPTTVLDVGCGTGLVSAAARQYWPQANLTAVDPAPAMLDVARQKVAGLETTIGHAERLPVTTTYDLVLSSMMLHWLDDPVTVMRGWMRQLNAGGRLAVALLVEGSFAEWRDLCRTHGVEDGLWRMPQAKFADDFADVVDVQDIVIGYPSAQAFLQRLKLTGAATPHTDHKPHSAAVMRRILRAADDVFPVTYRVAYILKSSQGKV